MLNTSFATPLSAPFTLDPLPHMRSVTILGATGSIGQNALRVVAEAEGRFVVEALTAMDNVNQLIADAKRFLPRFVAIGNPAHYDTLKAALAGTGITVAAGEDALVEAARQPADVVLSAIVGTAGLKSTLAAIERGALIALANKECLIAAGSVMKDAVKRSGARLLPVDSEHNAAFQVFSRTHPEWVEKITLTASGGPFRTWSYADMRNVTPEQAIRHPNWAMGAKISVDSATLMNKGLELIEAYHLFPLTQDQLEVLIHPESIIHSLVYYHDGSVLAQMSPPDMRCPISYALNWPERAKLRSARLDLAAMKCLNFEAPDPDRFPALSLARSALREGAAACITLNAANEVAVAAFLSRRIGFLDIAGVVETTLSAAELSPVRHLNDVFAVDQAARMSAENAISRFEQ